MFRESFREGVTGQHEATKFSDAYVIGAMIGVIPRWERMYVNRWFLPNEELMGPGIERKSQVRLREMAVDSGVFLLGLLSMSLFVSISTRITSLATANIFLHVRRES
jgi:hypothetical protein